MYRDQNSSLKSLTLQEAGEICGGVRGTNTFGIGQIEPLRWLYSDNTAWTNAMALGAGYDLEHVVTGKVTKNPNGW